ncbi:PKD domain-containing protein [Desulfobulbus rhabdoformis]|uniref:PKD domain-containing protein n=1 Tax=Desulfobulbus rhabdoformis TaxID=34032 RepID=UPI00196539E1|nr:PKD domain-containing protein [Desulfobulbus rhabdoformis]MBM9612996.1 PKD domain-containing protein [Desulfobulbus rhabdoformis]
MDCTVTLESDPTNFTLTATFADGTESPHSAPFAFFKTGSTDTDTVNASEGTDSAPVIVLTASLAEDISPLTVSFDASNSYALLQGGLSSYTWNFGDENSGEGALITHTYTTAGTYTVLLVVTDSLGNQSSLSKQVVVSDVDSTTVPENAAQASDPENSDASDGGTTDSASGDSALVNLHLEVGDVVVTTAWNHVSFEEPYEQPIVVTGPPSSRDADPCVVRIRNVTSEGFDIRIAEWTNQDGVHDAERLSYLVLEEGRSLLEDGSMVEAGAFAGNTTWQNIPFLSSFPSVPVVLASVCSINNDLPVIGRGVPSTSGFSFLLQGAESEKNTEKAEEIVHYVAWEPGQGELGDAQVEAVSEAATLTDAWEEVAFAENFLQAPALFVAIQSKLGMDTVTPRLGNISREKCKVQLQEEQSLDEETSHIGEQVAYLAFAATAPVRLATFNWTYNQDYKDEILGFRVFANDEELCDTYDIEARSLSCIMIESAGETRFSIATIDAEDDLGATSNIISYNTGAASPRLATFSWDFEQTEEKSIAGFAILVDGKTLCSTDDPSARELTCTMNQPTETASFTVRAIVNEGELSASSNSITYTP